MSDDESASSKPERVTFAPGETGHEDIALIIARTRYKGQTDALQWALRFAARHLERCAAAEARGREGRMEWVETDPSTPEQVLWRTAIDPL